MIVMWIGAVLILAAVGRALLDVHEPLPRWAVVSYLLGTVLFIAGGVTL